ncbi:MAG: AzlD domain-containing protein [Clostridia bacterium]|nr:AzlD domain-containing protein [Clostridia bacterium]
MNIGYILSAIAIMAITTYLIRMLPMVIFRKKITNKWIQSFLSYVPYSVLAVMTFPAIFKSTGSMASGIAGCIVAIILAYYKKSLLTVAVSASVAAFILLILGY